MPNEDQDEENASENKKPELVGLVFEFWVFVDVMEQADSATP